MSLITTLIPAYKSNYLAELFVGLKTQSFRDFRVVLSDDSPGGAITELIRGGAYDALIDTLDLVVLQGPRRGSFPNIQLLLQQVSGRDGLVHLHMDDDVIYPDFYRLHAMTHASAQLGATVSQRWLAAADGRPIAQLPLPEAIEQQPQRIVAVDGAALLETTIPLCRNWLGEFSNTVLSPRAVDRLRRASLGGLGYYGLADIGVLIDVSAESPIGFIHDHLGLFRSHPEQSTAARASHGLQCGYLAWAALALGARRAGRLADAPARRAVQQVLALTRGRYADVPAFQDYFALVERHAAELDALHAAFAPYWQRLLHSHPDSHPDSRAEVPATADARAA